MNRRSLFPTIVKLGTMLEEHDGGLRMVSVNMREVSP